MFHTGVKAHKYNPGFNEALHATKLNQRGWGQVWFLAGGVWIFKVRVAE